MNTLPEKYMEAVRAVLGRIDLDPASYAGQNEVVKARRYFDEMFSVGLSRSWSGATCGCPQRVFLHPLRGALVERYVEKLFEEIRAKHVMAAIVVVDAAHTETAWFQNLWEMTLCFTDHKIRPDDPCGSVFGYYGVRPSVFKWQFMPFGSVVHDAARMPVVLR